ncbi:MAG: ABC transporter ATP-binding protein [Flavobacteriales bacterium]|nr:ABC transporter ATP-binding protein [Flavobacteriales bacterium]
MEKREVIRVEGLKKRYQLGVIGSSLITDEVSALWAKIRSKPDPRSLIGSEPDSQKQGNEFWSLRGVDFSVKEGEILGIIGRNGAGKSTLLKLLSRISLPTTGKISMRGKVSSLLEVGTGFHPELTGMENIYLNGSILGMRKAEIDEKLQQIIDFSGIQHHLDTPIKRYSSGMKVRLGFAVAAHLEPEILIVDEVLAVGDAEFQRKCLGSMKEVAARGRTILFVSHSMNAIQNLCTRCIWLDEGKVRMDGPTDQVVLAYLNENSTQVLEYSWDKTEAPGNDEMKLLGCRIRSSREDGSFMISDPVVLEYDILNYSIKDDDVNIRFGLRTGNDVVAFVADMLESSVTVKWPLGRSTVRSAKYRLIFSIRAVIVLKRVLLEKQNIGLIQE